MANAGIPAGGSLLKIRVSNLLGDTTEPAIRALFLPHGVVQFYSRPVNEFTGRPHSVAYVELPATQGEAAIKALNGKRMGNQVLTVEVAPPLASWAENTSRSPQSTKPTRVVLPYLPGQRGASRGS